MASAVSVFRRIEIHLTFSVFASYGNDFVVTPQLRVSGITPNILVRSRRFDRKVRGVGRRTNQCVVIGNCNTSASMISPLLRSRRTLGTWAQPTKNLIAFGGAPPVPGPSCLALQQQEFSSFPKIPHSPDSTWGYCGEEYEAVETVVKQTTVVDSIEAKRLS